MKVKLLLFPLSIVIALALGIFWIQPMASEALMLRAKVNSAQEKLDKISQVVSNIDRLDRSLDENNGNEVLVRTYLPEKGSDDRILDEVNFLSGDSGLLLLATGMDRVSSEAALAAQAASEAAADKAELDSVSASRGLIAPDSSSSTLPVFVSSSPMSRIRSVDVSISVFGKYEQIRDFADRIYHANHFQRFLSVDIKKKEAKKEGDAAPETAPDVLEGNIVVRFSFLPTAHVSEGSFLVAFDRSSFDFGLVQDLLVRATREISPLTVAPTPRSNPFLR